MEQRAESRGQRAWSKEHGAERRDRIQSEELGMEDRYEILDLSIKYQDERHKTQDQR